MKKQPDATGAGLDPVPLAERQLGDEFPVLKAGAPRSAETGAHRIQGIDATPVGNPAELDSVGNTGGVNVKQVGYRPESTRT